MYYNIAENAVEMKQLLPFGNWTNESSVFSFVSMVKELGCGKYWAKRPSTSLRRYCFLWTKVLLIQSRACSHNGSFFPCLRWSIIFFQIQKCFFVNMVSSLSSMFGYGRWLFLGSLCFCFYFRLIVYIIVSSRTWSSWVSLKAIESSYCLYGKPRNSGEKNNWTVPHPGENFSKNRGAYHFYRKRKNSSR